MRRLALAALLVAAALALKALLLDRDDAGDTRDDRADRTEGLRYIS